MEKLRWVRCGLDFAVANKYSRSVFKGKTCVFNSSNYLLSSFTIVYVLNWIPAIVFSHGYQIYASTKLLGVLFKQKHRDGC